MLEELESLVCSTCGTELAPALKACPQCGRLIHADDLKRLAQEADQADREGDLTTALRTWRAALDLLPPNTKQHESIAARVSALARRVDEESPRPPATRPKASDSHSAQSWKNGAGAAGLGGLALAAWKFKFLAVFLLTKGKLLLLGLTKASTLFSMLLSLGVYWAAFGWKWALGLVVSLYIHEMGHVAALARYGIKITAITFVPAVGARVAYYRSPKDVRQDARIALAGPLWGFGAAAIAGAVGLVSGSPMWAAIARVGAWLNLMNLLPIPVLDGNRAFGALNRPERWLLVAVIACLWATVGDGLLVLLLIVTVFRTLSERAPTEPDRGALSLFALLVVALSSMLLIPVPGFK